MGLGPFLKFSFGNYQQQSNRQTKGDTTINENGGYCIIPTTIWWSHHDILGLFWWWWWYLYRVITFTKLPRSPSSILYKRLSVDLWCRVTFSFSHHFISSCKCSIGFCICLWIENQDFYKNNSKEVCTVLRTFIVFIIVSCEMADKYNVAWCIINFLISV